MQHGHGTRITNCSYIFTTKVNASEIFEPPGNGSLYHQIDFELREHVPYNKTLTLKMAMSTDVLKKD